MSHDLSRRSFLAAGGVTVASISGAYSAEEPNSAPKADKAEIGTRVSLADLGEENKVLASYRKAVGVMKALPDRDPTSWAFQANMHGAPRAAGNNPDWRGCMHQNWWFLPWHRGYLYYFERIIRKHSGDASFLLPYWAWEQPKQDRLPAPFRAARMGGGANHLYDGTRFAKVNAGAEIRPAGMVGTFADGWDRAKRVAEFTTRFPATAYGGLKVKGTDLPTRPDGSGAFGVMEAQAHNLIHVGIGGNMGDPATAARDPIFWLHHANVDRLWNRWLDEQGHYNPDEQDWGKQSFAFFDENGKRVVSTVNEILDLAREQYRYDDDRRAVVFGAAPKKGKVMERQASVVAAVTPRLILGSTPFTKRLTVEKEGAPRLVGALKAGPSESPPVVALRVENIEPPAKADVVFEVFVVKTGDKPAAKYSLGPITFFGLTGDHGHGRPQDKGFNQSFDATDVLQRLRRENEGELPAIEVLIVPHSSDPGVSDEELAKQKIQVPISNVTLSVIDAQK